MRHLLFCLQFGALFTFFTLIGGQLVVPSTPYNSTEDNLSLALEEITRTFHRDLDELSRSIEAYHESATASADAPTLQEKHLATRKAFKRVAYLLEYIDPESVKRYLNGAPLPKTEPSVPEIVIIAPKGLQRLDELVFSEPIDVSKIKALTARLKKDFVGVHAYASGRSIQHRHVFEAIRLELVRLFTLGVTGFDTPGSTAGLEEGKITLSTLNQAYLAYQSMVARQDATLDQEIHGRFTEGIRQLDRGDFSTFDRFRFLISVINPLTTQLTKAQALLEIEFAKETPLPLPHNFRAARLFDQDWLNPDYYAQLTPTPLRDKRRELGRLLFFDPILSANNQMACASCHQPSKAFTDGQARSLARAEKGTVKRNSPTLVNSVFAEHYFYDLREEKLERQVRHVIVDSLEFGTDFITILEKLNHSQAYRDLFAEAYADQPQYALSSWSISDALAQYVASLRGQNSPFDQMARGEAPITPEVRLGFNLFMGKAACGTCHFAPTFSGLVPPLYAESESEVLGVPASPIWEGAKVDPDLGRLDNGKPGDEAYFHAFSFKTPTVRNVAITSPYMHNGVYATLEEVMKFYQGGGGAGIGIDLDHQTLPTDSLDLAEEEISALIHFMESLTDTTGLSHLPKSLPTFTDHPEWNKRTIGGRY